ncbi:hypothetical protein M409DRAFT_63164 [Zasmidium cellare ATCC 36951]|uniref:tripeptidyl-peptidase II n=1 Tax=Zasmidium cellare ATCC 36951 TaxID=1080233 RepID=A0A6A6D4A8_ZASCE|nr:uncharacterized protein M409DRAFT_63164 [Zasmidium cellare ATCC 36951]KAF2172496.1 hypothetical protein M409DRAFT_63164 [Zasmidium cellare ATCC 36951]
MLLSSLFVAGAFLASSSASPVTNPLIVHEKRSNIPHGWVKRYSVDGGAILPMRIALTQSNLDQAHEWLMEVSSPDSLGYGKHWSADKIANAFAPSEEHVHAVKTWLLSAGITTERIAKSRSMGWLTFDATIDEAEKLLDTKYHVYEHEETGQPHIACEEYKIPASLKDKIDFVYPSVHFDVKLKIRQESDSQLENRKFGPGHWQPWNPKNPGGGSLPKWNHWWLPHSSIIKDLQNCDQQITPWCLRYLYKFGPGNSKNPKNSYGIVEYTPQAYVPSDLDLFFKNFSTKQVGARPTLQSIDGGYSQQSQMSFNYNGESDLDLEYAMSLVYPQSVTLYQVGDNTEGASFNDFLDALDSSYCAGDDPTQDAAYPDPYCPTQSQDCYKGPKDCGGFAATKVISTSYAYNEHDLTPAYEQRQCNEYMKLGLMGVSVLYSSGDYGVAGNGGQCIDGAGPDAPYINGTLGGRFNPSFPGTCPYITSVGATQIKPGTNIVTSRTQPEQACETVIYSGGGFSNVFSLPSYQANAVQTWFREHPPPYGSDKFNNSQKTRGFPDISANGANYVVAVDGNFTLVYGTSASSPTLGSILTLINEARYNAGKSSIGFINPVAYAHPEAFNDITEGGNQGCNTPGFSAATGWDPVTGLGTPNFPRLRDVFLRM